MSDSEIITTLDWTDDESSRIAILLYRRSVGYSWKKILVALILAISFVVLAVMGGDGEDILGFWIIAGISAAIILLDQAVGSLDRRVTKMIDETFERSGKRVTKSKEEP